MHDVELLVYSLGCSAALAASVAEYVRSLPEPEQTSLTNTMYQRIAGNDSETPDRSY